MALLAYLKKGIIVFERNIKKKSYCVSHMYDVAVKGFSLPLDTAVLYDL